MGNISLTRTFDEVSKIHGELVGEVMAALLSIVGALKRQPGFDVDAFEAELREAAASCSHQSQTARLVLLLAAGPTDEELKELMPELLL